MVARILSVLVVAAAALPAGAAVLYKSVTPSGTVMFSDTPPPAGARIVEERVVGSEATGPGSAADLAGLPVYQSVEFDAAIAKANEQLDAAEKALALARRGTWQPVEGLRLRGPQRRPGDDERIEFYRNEVAAARKALIDLVRKRQYASVRWEARQRGITLAESR